MNKELLDRLKNEFAAYSDVIEFETTVLGEKVLMSHPVKCVAVDLIVLADRSWARFPDKNVQLAKKTKFNEGKWTLIQIFEDELENRFECAVSRIKHAMGITENRIAARKCKVVDVHPSDARNFLNLNHIQGAGIGGNLRVGLMYKGELVSVMTVGKARFNKAATHELLRFASKMGYSVVGGAGKLLAEIKERLGPGSCLISYADARYGDGDTYTKIGFKKCDFSHPCYWYFKVGTTKRFHRSNYQKHKLHKLLDHFDPSKTELENTTANGYDRVFDSGNNVFLLHI